MRPATTRDHSAAPPPFSSLDAGDLLDGGEIGARFTASLTPAVPLALLLDGPPRCKRRACPQGSSTFAVKRQAVPEGACSSWASPSMLCRQVELERPFVK